MKRLRPLLTLVLGFGVTACSSLTSVAPSSPASAERQTQQATEASRAVSNPTSASASLLAEGRSERRAGHLVAATGLIERALRLDPNNAELWIERGELELEGGDRAQAAAMARKALTLAADDTRLTARAERLLRASQTR